MAAGEGKGGSDLDVFEGLGKKNSTRAPANVPRTSAPPPPPPSLRQPEAQKPPAALGFAQTVSASQAPPVPGTPHHPPAQTATLPSASSVASPTAGPPSQAPRTPPPPPPGRAALPAVVPPPSKSPISAPNASAGMKALSAPPPAGGAATPAGRPSHGTGGLDMDWDEEEEATHVLDRDTSKAEGAPRPGTLDGFAATSPSAGARLPPGPSAKQTLVGIASTAPPNPSPSVRPPSLPPPPPPSMQPFARPSAPPPAPMMQSAAPPPPAASVRPAAPAPSAPPPAQQPLQNGNGAGGFPYQQNTSPMAMPPRVVSARSAQATIEDAPELPRVSRSRMEATAVVRPQASRPTGLIVLAGIGVCVLVAAVFFLMPHSGQLAVNVADSKGGAVRNLQISIDGKPTCDSAPCLVRSLSAGSHTVKVEATGFDQPADKAVAVESGKDSTVDFTLSPTSGSGGTGIKITGSQPGEKLYVDDKEIGALPQEIHDLTPGTHKVRVSAGERYAAVEKTVTVGKDEFQDLGAVSLKVVKGRATVILDTPGAKVFLVSGSDRRELPTLPMSIDLDPSKQWSLVATKPGFSDFTQPLSFDDGQADKEFHVSLLPKTASPAVGSMSFSPPPSTPPPSYSPPAAPQAPPSRPSTPHVSAPSAATAGGEGTLNMNSIPSSSVVLDGKPIGNTPQIGVSVSAGTHTVVFVNAEQGFKKTVSVTVAAGETKKVHP